MNKLYRDTVTLYHADAAAQTVVRTVLRGVCWQQGRRELPDAGLRVGGESHRDHRELARLPRSQGR